VHSPLTCVCETVLVSHSRPQIRSSKLFPQTEPLVSFSHSCISYSAKCAWEVTQERVDPIDLPDFARASLAASVSMWVRLSHTKSGDVVGVHRSRSRSPVATVLGLGS
jgi:hypothetical protein